MARLATRSARRLLLAAAMLFAWSGAGAQQETPAPLPQMPSMFPGLPGFGAATVSAANPTPVPMYLPDVTPERMWATLWPALEKIRNNDISGVEEFERCISVGDKNYLEANAKTIVEIFAPGAPVASSREAKLFALQVVARHLPETTPTLAPRMRNIGSLGVAEILIASTDGRPPVIYRTPIIQEHGRWVTCRMFFVRDFVLTPLLATYKSTRKQTLLSAEAVYVTQGLIPFQEQIVALYRYVGYVPAAAAPRTTRR